MPTNVSKPSPEAVTEDLLLKVADLVLEDRADEVPAELRRAVDPPRKSRGHSLREPTRARLAVRLANATSAKEAESGTINGIRGALNASPPSKGVPSAGEPILGSESGRAVEHLVREFERRSDLLDAGLFPTQTVLLSGPPGVGKTMLIEHIADRLGRPLVRLETTSVIGSLLGESSRALVGAFEEARASEAVLGLDEIDALAKRRDDENDVGEYKRFVTSLLVEMDRWEGPFPIVAATNHLDLLDPALGRRFEMHLEMELPNVPSRQEMIEQRVNLLSLKASRGTIRAVAAVTGGKSGAQLDHLVRKAARRSVLDQEDFDRALILATAPPRDSSREGRELFAAAAKEYAGLTTRQIGDLLGCSHTSARRLAIAGQSTSNHGGFDE